MVIEDHYEGIMSHNLQNSIVKDIGDVKALPANWETATAPLKHYTVMPRLKLQHDDDDCDRFCCREVIKGQEYLVLFGSFDLDFYI